MEKLMTIPNVSVINDLVASAIGPDAAACAIGRLAIDQAIDAPIGGTVSRASFAMALNVLLFADLLQRVPTGAAYAEDVLASGGRIVFDHGALRTVRFADGPTGALPAGEMAFARILIPLGYEVAEIYPLPKLRMTGRAYRHADAPEAIPQFFVSELHTERFDPAFQAVARNIFGNSRDPLGAQAQAVLSQFADTRRAPYELAMSALAEIASVFGRHHAAPLLADYEALLAQSPEAAWIATEGNAFNHATDRVLNVERLADAQRALGRPMKDSVEVSASGRVRQTAFLADPVDRSFRDEKGNEVVRSVPGSFYEFITREVDPATGQLDLRFDSGNAQGIFAMTQAV
jgi:hypothetical protein